MRSMTVRTVRALVALIALGSAALGVAACGTGDEGGATGPATAPAASAAAARVYRDTVGDVPAGQADLTQVRISNDAITVNMAFRFASAPPLRTSAAGKWTDMLLVGIDVPPIGPGPTPAGWRGLDYAIGMHGVDPRARFRPMEGTLTPGTRPDVRTLQSQVRGAEISLAVPRAWIGDPASFRFTVAVGREGEDESSSGGDQVPPTGTARYTLH